MTLQIKELGGLPEGEIKLLIEDSANRRESALDRKLDAHREEINKRLERTEDIVHDNLSRLIDLQGSVSSLESSFESIDVDNKEQTRLLQEVVKQGRDWHEDDLKFREDVQGRLGKIEVDQVSIRTQAKRVKWIGSATHHSALAVKFVFAKACEADFWKVVAWVSLLWFLHLVSPVLYRKAVKMSELFGK